RGRPHLTSNFPMISRGSSYPEENDRDIRGAIDGDLALPEFRRQLEEKCSMRWWREKDYSPQAAHPAGRADARCLTAFDPNLRSKLLILLQVLLTGFVD
ncbi:hypothetical protein ABIE06_000563, partial [Pantoea dispersa]